MSDYIERQKAVKAIGEEYIPRTDFERGMVSQLSCDKEKIKALPSADVAPVVHGRWIDEDPAFAEYSANCSVCGYEIDVHDERGYFNFCPYCGAKMDGGDEHG